MTINAKDIEFLEKAKEILSANGCFLVQICDKPFNDTLYLGSYSYVNRGRLVKIATEILKLN